MFLLQGAEARHLATVIRATPGDRVVLFCGDGAEYPAIVTSIAKRNVTLDVGAPNRPDRELPFRLEVAVAFPKSDRGDFLIEKLTELGATRVVPLISQRSVVRPRLEKLRRAVIEASKQCGRNVLMEIVPAMEWKQYFSHSTISRIRLIAHPNEQINAAKPPNLGQPYEDMAIAIGPEGGWADEEINCAIKSGWQVVGMGPRILRIETAAIALTAYFALSNASSA